jgi:hypothetical protein
MVNLGTEMKMLYEAQEKILKASNEYQKDKEKGDIEVITTTQYPIESLVLSLYPHNKVPSKQITKWEGPFRVVSQEGSVVTIRNCHSKKEVSRHVSRIKQFYHNEGDTDVEFALCASRDKHEFIVESIMDHTGELKDYKNKDNKYLVKWEGYENDSATWEPYTHVADCSALTEYLAKHEVKDLVAIKDERLLRRSVRVKDKNG